MYLIFMQFMQYLSICSEHPYVYKTISLINQLCFNCKLQNARKCKFIDRNFHNVNGYLT